MAMPITNLLINGISGVSVGGSGTTLKIFPQAPGASIGVASTKNGYLYCPDSNKVNNQRLSVRATGNFTIGSGTASSPNVTVGLYLATFAGNNPAGAVTIGGQTTAPYAGATAIVSQTFNGSSDLLVTGYPFAINVDLQGDNTSGVLQAMSGNIAIDGVAGTFTASAAGTGINMNSPVPFALVVGVTFSVSDTAALANLYQLDLSA